MSSTFEVWNNLTESQKRSAKKNYEYWAERENKQRQLNLQELEQQQKKIDAVYENMYRWCEQEVNAFYGKYADAEEISINLAKQKVSNADIAEYERLAQQYVREHDFSERANEEMRLYNATMRINRLELLKARMGLHLVAGTDNLGKYYTERMEEEALKEIKRKAGILGSDLSEAEMTARAKAIANSSFYNATGEERLWSHMDRLRSSISIELQKGLIAGVSPRQMASNIRKQTNRSRYDAERLMRTEFARVQTEATLEQLRDSGAEFFIYIAPNAERANAGIKGKGIRLPEACPVCKELNNKVFRVDEAEIGLNAPPMHPNCYCTIAEYKDESEYENWLSWLENGGTSEEYNAMQNGYALNAPRNANGTIKKSGGSDLLKKAFALMLALIPDEEASPQKAQEIQETLANYDEDEAYRLWLELGHTKKKWRSMSEEQRLDWYVEQIHR